MAEGTQSTMQRVREAIPQSRQFLGEVRTELSKVHWPTRRETIAATIVVLVVVGLVATWLASVDAVLSFLFTRFLGE